MFIIKDTFSASPVLPAEAAEPWSIQEYIWNICRKVYGVMHESVFESQGKKRKSVVSTRGWSKTEVEV